jgi:hypothetical protein
MASFEPSEEGISQVIDFAGLDAVDDRRMVVHALKVGSVALHTSLLTPLWLTSA